MKPNRKLSVHSEEKCLYAKEKKAEIVFEKKKPRKLGWGELGFRTGVK